MTTLHLSACGHAQAGKFTPKCVLTNGGNYTLVLLQYSEGDHKINIPDEIQVFEIPDFLHYKGKRSKYWYTKDSHPKPLLNKVLAHMLSKRILKYFEDGNKDIFRRINKEMKNKVKIKAILTKISSNTYQVKLNFNTPMRSSYSYSSSFKAKKHFWEDEYKFNIIFESNKEITALVIAINPMGYKNAFVTEKNRILPSQKLQIKRRGISR